MCLESPIPALPTLPAPLTLNLATPPVVVAADLTFCCKLASFSERIPPIPISSTILSPAVITTLNGYITSLNTYLKALPLKCPIE